MLVGTKGVNALVSDAADGTGGGTAATLVYLQMKSALSRLSRATIIFSRSSLCNRGLMTGNLKDIVFDVIFELMSGNNQGKDGNYGGNKKLPRPEVVLDKEAGKCHHTGNDAANGHGTEA